MIISVSKSEIFSEVEKRSSLEGVQLPERFENVWASEEEGRFLDSYWIEGYTAVVQLMKRYLASSTLTYNLSTYNKDEVLTIQATMPERYNTLLDGSVATDVKMLIACNVLTGWLSVTNSAAAAKYEEEARGYTEDMRVKLLYRSEPTADMHNASNDSTAFEKGEALAKADSDNVAFDKESALAKADSDNVAFEKGEALAKADGETTGFDDAMPIERADEDTEVLKDKDAEIYGTKAMECEKNIYPAYECIGEAKNDDVPMVQYRGCCKGASVWK